MESSADPRPLDILAVFVSWNCAPHRLALLTLPTVGSVKNCPMQMAATAAVERNDATAMGQKSLGVPSLERLKI